MSVAAIRSEKRGAVQRLLDGIERLGNKVPHPAVMFVALCLLVAPVPFSVRLSTAAGGVLMGLLFSLAYMTETTEHRAVKAGYPPGTTARVREERVERERLERRAHYRDGGSGSFD